MKARKLCELSPATRGTPVYWRCFPAAVCACVTNTFDLLDRLTVRTWTDGISEGWLFATNGLIAFTNRDGKVTLYGRDGAGCLVSVTNANREVVLFGLNSAVKGSVPEL
jgi:YD repeat-containing protein